MFVGCRVVRTPEARGDSTGAVLGQVSIGSCTILRGEY